MIKKRYTIQLGLNYEIEEIIDHCKQDKQLNFWEFMTQINEQDKAFKKLKKENEKLKSKLEYAEEILNNIGYDLVHNNTENRWVIE